jgi:aspartyl-tRNA(Asn)/glutamyl-tRNA(Gln) amidotransferase subunit B
MKSYMPTIGLEIHAELKTATKMFCGSRNAPHDAEPNTHVCPICMGHPGTLPTINKEAVRQVLMVGVALEGTLASFTEFDRKNYFYPDIPKGYQISQYLHPLVAGGELSGVAITRVHLEEDTARSLHDQGVGSIVDYNRAGVPLMELVTEPVMHDAKTAGDFARELQLLLRTLGVSDANMERGEMRVEANISVSDSDAFGTKVEVKNLNSFRAVERAIEYEVKRQSDLLYKGEEVAQETRGWDENKGKTFSQRSKETADDYRYFPEPDLPKLDITSIDLFSRIAEEIPELPAKKRERYGNLGLSREAVEVIISDALTAAFFDETAEKLQGDAAAIKLVGNYLTSDVPALLAARKERLRREHVGQFADLIALAAAGTITSRVAKDLLPEVLFEGLDAKEAIADRGLAQQHSTDALLPVIRQVIEENPGPVAEYKAGKETVMQFLIGQGMKLTKGSANPATLGELFAKELGK